jgi:4'-phosphopantetheinyl transferase
MPPVQETGGRVDVWRADLAAVGDELEDLLCAEELARAARIVRERERVLWARARGVLRALLGRYLDRDPRTLEFVLGPHGKPALLPGGWEPGPDAAVARAAGAARPDLRFNLSHSGTLALYAVSVGREVGVDIECARERYTADFLRAWVAREAAVKCRGSGLAVPLEGSLLQDDLWSTELDVGRQASAAVCVEGGRCALAVRDYTPPVRSVASALAAKAPPGKPHRALPPSLPPSQM